MAINTLFCGDVLLRKYSLTLKNLEEGEYWKKSLYVAVLCTIIMVHKGASSSYRSVDCIWLWSCLVSSLSSERLCVFGLHRAIKFFCLRRSLYLSVSWAWWDGPLMWLTNHCPSVLWHCCLGHLTHKIVSEMTYNGWNVMLNTTRPYYTITIIALCVDNANIENEAG